MIRQRRNGFNFRLAFGGELQQRQHPSRLAMGQPRFPQLRGKPLFQRQFPCHRDDRTGVSHSFSWRGCSASDKCCHGFGDVILDVFCSLFFCIATNLANHQNDFSLIVILESLEEVDVRCAHDRVTTQSNAGRLAQPNLGGLPNGFIGQRSTAAHDADRTWFVNVTGHNSDLAFPWCDHSRTVRSNENRVASAHEVIHRNHVENWHPFGDGADHFDARIDRFANGIGREGCRNEDHARVGTRLLDGFFHRIKHGKPFDGFTRLAWRYAADHFGAIVFATFGMEFTGLSGDALADNPRIFVNKNAHDFG